MTARAALRAATADDHRRVDSIFSRFALGEAEGYGRFLDATAAAFLPAEARLERAGVARVVDDWAERRRATALESDLAALGRTPGAGQPDDAPMDEAEMLGTLYVLEGSRLGGTLLKRSIPDGAPRAFLGSEAPQGAWRRFIALIDDRLTEPALLDRAIIAARQTFASFEAAGRAALEPAHG